MGSAQVVATAKTIAMHGGTLMRLLYSAPRYSEDLDFALERDKAHYDLRAYLHAIRSELVAEGYTVELKVNGRRSIGVK